MIKILLDNKIKKLGLSNREAARQIGIAHTTLNRILDGGDYDLDTLIQLSAWLGVNPATLLGTTTPHPDQLAAQVAVVLEAYPELTRVFEKAMQRVANGTMSLDTFKDLAAYAAFRMQNSGGDIEDQQSQQADIEPKQYVISNTQPPG